MRKNLGNGIVKKSIIVAMSVMLITASPAINIAAAEEAQVVEFDAVAAPSEENQATEAPSAETEITPAEQDLVNKLEQDFTALGKEAETLPETDYDDVVDKAHQIAKDDITNAVDTEVSEATTAADEAETAAQEAQNVATNIENYNSTTDELLNTDQNIVASVEGNTNNIVETITKDGDILLNVEDENGAQTQVKVEDYTQQKADVAISAADTAKESLNNILTSSDANIEEERAKIDNAIATATVAKNEAETAYNAAHSVLIDEIKRYNAYATKYGAALYEYTDENGVKSTPAYTEEELNGLADLSMNKDAIESGLSNIEAEDLSKQLEEIKTAEHLVASCGAGVEIAKNAIEEIKAKENHLVSGLENMMNNAKVSLDNATNQKDKDAYSALYEAVKAVYDEYTKPFDSSVTDNNPAEEPNSYDELFHYSVDSASGLANEVDAVVANANNDLYGEDGAVNRYNKAYDEYMQIKSQYDSYVADKTAVDVNFEDLQIKLANAEAAVKAAHQDLQIAIDKVNEANNIKKQFEDVVSDTNTNPGTGSGSGSDSSSSTSTANAGSSVGNSAAPAVLAIEDVVTPLTAAISDEQVPLTAAITDEQVPLADSVPKTGDSAAAASAVGATGVVSMLGALFLNLKKRTLR